MHGESGTRLRLWNFAVEHEKGWWERCGDHVTADSITRQTENLHFSRLDTTIRQVSLVMIADCWCERNWISRFFRQFATRNSKLLETIRPAIMVLSNFLLSACIMISSKISRKLMKTAKTIVARWKKKWNEKFQQTCQSLSIVGWNWNSIKLTELLRDFGEAARRNKGQIS